MEERQQGEGESASETSEKVGGVRGRGFLLSRHHFSMNQEKDEDSDDEEEEEEGPEVFTYRPAGQLLYRFSEKFGFSRAGSSSWG